MKTQRTIFLSLGISLILAFTFSNVFAQENVKPRTIVTTDGEVDDMDSFIRFLLYVNEMKVEGLVYSSSMWHYSGDGKGTPFISEMEMTKRIYGERTELRWCGTTWMQELIDKYAGVYPGLIKHDPGYPTPGYLKSIIRVGNIEFEGEMEKVTEGSEFIKNILLDDNNEPVYVQMWGGTNTLARALKSIEEEYKGKPGWEDIYRKVSDKTWMYIILDQDATYRKYIAPNWPKIRTVYNTSQFWCVAYAWPRAIPPSQHKYLEGNWFSKHILFDHGPLLESYYTWGDGMKITGDPDHTHGSLEEAKKNGRAQYDFISEGDSPSYFYLLNMGLQKFDDPSYGGLGGRFIQSAENPRKWVDAPGVTDFNPETGKDEATFPQARWTEVLQKDFAARADWCVKNYAEANHAPAVQIESKTITAQPGETVKLLGTASDPDQNKLTGTWWNYAEAGSYPGKVQVKQTSEFEAEIRVSDDAVAGQVIHMIFQVTDDGTPELTGFGRVIINVK